MNFSMFPSLLTSFLSISSPVQSLNVTAISTANGASVLECWSIISTPQSFAGAINYPTGSFRDAYIGVIPPKTQIGQAWAPHVLYAFVLSGLVRIRIPDSSQEAWIQGGKYGILIAADTKAVSKKGHLTDFPGAASTVIAQFPVAEGKIPDHEVLYEGPCNMTELIGL